jgi:hypothetical protein
MLYSGRKNVFEFLVFLASISILIFHHLFAYTGHYGYDDLHYAKLSADLLNGNMDYHDHYSFRWPLLMLTALSYKVFGINDFASSLPSLIISGLCLIAVFVMLKPYGIKSLIIGLGLTVFDGWSLHYSDKIMPDIYINLAIILSIYFIYTYKYSSSRHNIVWNAFGLSASFMFGFMAKESMLLVLPLLVYLSIVDVFLKRDLKFWKYSFLIAIGLLIIYFGGIAILTGSAVQRFTAILENPYLSTCSYNVQSLEVLIKRISYQFYFMLVNTGLFLAPGILIVCIAGKWNKYFFRFEDRFSFLGVSVIILLLSSNFMSASMTSYNPLCLDPRHYMFLVPISAIAISMILKEELNNPVLNKGVCIMLLALTIISFMNSPLEFRLLYLPVLILWVLKLLLDKYSFFNKVFPLAFVMILSLKMFDNVRFANEVNYDSQKQVVMDQYINSDKNAYIISDEVQSRLGEYYNAYGLKSKVRFLKFDAFQADTLDSNKEKFILLNPYTQQLSNLSQKDLPYYALNIDSTNLIFKSEAPHMEIYKMNKLPIPKLFIDFRTGFEKEQHSILQFNNLTTDKKNHGEYSSKVEEYSYTYQFLVDSMHLQVEDQLLIQIKLAFWEDNNSNSKIVVSLDENDKPYVYEAKSCDHYVKAYSIWNTAESAVLIEGSSIKPETNLKVYIWNPEKKEMYLDDFEVKLSFVR